MKKAVIFSSHPDESQLEFLPLECHLWAEEYPAFVSSQAAVYAVKNKGLCVIMRAFEPCPRAVYEHRDDPVCRDSCMEFFFQPFADDERYINLEVNPKGTYLCAVGKDRYDRAFIKELTAHSPDVSVLRCDGGWAVRLAVSETLISDVYKRNFNVDQLDYIRANIYKCGDETASPHYSSMFPVGTEAPDFHRSEYFGKIHFRNERD